MSNLSVDLKVIETHAPSVARAAGTSEDRVIAGLVRLWHRCWSTARETLQRSEVAGAFGAERLDDLISALEVDFLERQADGSFRVRGADQYLRIKEGRRKGAEKTNAALAERRSSVAPASLPNALSPNTEHRTPNTEHQEAGPTPQEQLREVWNDHRGPKLPEWRKSKHRDTPARERLKDRPASEWAEVVKRIASSAFCTGTNDRGWKADPDWLLKPGTAVKVLEGKYDGGSTALGSNWRDDVDHTTGFFEGLS